MASRCRSMAGGRDGEETASVKELISEPVVRLDEDDENDDSSPESEIAKLRGRWELASVLNFLKVFRPLIGDDLKIRAEEIEAGLIKPDSSIAQLHKLLLKGIPPVSKTLNASDVWVISLCNKLAVWWPWVGEGENPLTAAKGEEMSIYKGLDPVDRLLILKALCEIRADQNDAVSFINDAVKGGAQISSFRKNRIGGNENGTSYWYDEDSVIGHRLYKEVCTFKLKTPKSEAPLSLSSNCFHWETLATDLDEFQKVAAELSSSGVAAEVAVGKIIAIDAIPNIEKFKKKKERELKRKRMQEMRKNDYLNSYRAGVPRSSRSHKPINYTFHEYDRVMNEAIRLTEKGRTAIEPGENRKHIDEEKAACIEGESENDSPHYAGTGPRDGSSKKANSIDGDIPQDAGTGHRDSTSDKADSLGGDDETPENDGIDDDDDDDRDDLEDYSVKDSEDSGTVEDDDDDDRDVLEDYSVKDSEDSGTVEDDSGTGDDSIGSRSDSDGWGQENANIGIRRNAKFLAQKPKGSRRSERLANVNENPVMETRNLGSKNRLRQRPVRNSAIGPVVSDSEDENSSK